MKITSSKPHRSNIDLSDETAARAWIKKLGRSKDEIAAVIERVGDNAETVKKEFTRLDEVGGRGTSAVTAQAPKWDREPKVGLMAAPLGKRVPADPAAINLREDWEITYWCSSLRCTEAELRAAMDKCGSIITDEIRTFLERQKSSRLAPWQPLWVKRAASLKQLKTSLPCA
jgi:hypothetical protein